MCTSRPARTYAGGSRRRRRDDQLFQVNGIMIDVDPDGNAIGYEDVFSKIVMCRKHYQEWGLGTGHVERFIR